MAKYNLLFNRSLAKDLCQISEQDVTAILQRIEALANDPGAHGCEKLSAQERYRVRQGVYRIIYQIIGEQLVITAVKTGRRREVYKST